MQIETNASYRSVLIKELQIVFCFLLYYITLYYITKLTYTDDYFLLQKTVTRGFLLHVTIQGIVIVKNYLPLIFKYLRIYLFEPSLPYNISILRIIFFLYLANIYLKYSIDFLPVIGSGNKTALPYIGWLIDWLPVSKEIYILAVYCGVVACVMIAIGYKTRFFLLLNAFFVFYIVASPSFYGKLWHNQIFIWITWFFAFSNCYDAFSLDSYFNQKKIHKSPDYTFPVRFVWLQLGLIYFWSGFDKLYYSGFQWALSDSMINQIQLEWVQNYDTLPAIRIDKYPVLLYIGGIGTILFELGYLFLVLKKSWRWIAAVGGIIMHNLIAYFMYISFSSLWGLYFFYFDFNLLFGKKIKSDSLSSTAGYSKKAFYIGLFILSMNFLAGMFNINSYPFSSYPKYSAIINDTIKIIDFKPFPHTEEVHRIGKKNNFDWESYGWMEYYIIKDFEKQQNVEAQLLNYWEIWTSHNIELQSADSVQVYLSERPVSPEGKGRLKTIGYICTIKPKERTKEKSR